MKQPSRTVTSNTLASIATLVCATICATTFACRLDAVFDGDEGEDDFADPAAPDAQPVASLRVINVVSDSEAVDVYMAGKGELVAYGIAFGDSSDIYEMPVGNFAFEVRLAGSSPDSVALTTSSSIYIDEGDEVSIVIGGLVDSEGSNDQLRVLPFENNFANPAADSAAIQLVHAVPDAQAFAVDM